MKRFLNHAPGMIASYSFIMILLIYLTIALLLQVYSGIRLTSDGRSSTGLLIINQQVLIKKGCRFELPGFSIAISLRDFYE